MKKFEYKILKFKKGSWGIADYDSTELSLNKLGMEGWELVTVTDHTSHTGETILVFKREILS